jgi:hypothetical protein
MKPQIRSRRHRSVLSVTSVAVILTFAMVLGSGILAIAAEPPDQVIDFPAGIACPDFALRVELRGGNQVVKEFTDQNGNLVRMLFAGKGSALSFTNLHIPSDLVVAGVTAHRKPPEVRICRLRNQSAVGTRPPSTSTPHCPACMARR